MNNNKNEKSGFEPIDNKWIKTCFSPSHNPPMHLYIPPGQQYVHICPTCGAKIIMLGSTFTW